MGKPRLVDLFCGAGGATRGYQLAGFHVTGVDIDAQPNYCGDDFVQADAMTFPLEGFDAVHAWMNRREISQAIPPAFTHHIGLQLIAALAEPTVAR